MLKYDWTDWSVLCNIIHCHVILVQCKTRTAILEPIRHLSDRDRDHRQIDVNDPVWHTDVGSQCWFNVIKPTLDRLHNYTEWCEIVCRWECSAVENAQFFRIPLVRHRSQQVTQICFEILSQSFSVVLQVCVNTAYSLHWCSCQEKDVIQ